MHAMKRFSLLARRYGFDVLIALAAIAAALEVAFRENPLRAPRTPLWFAVPAVVLVVLPLLSRATTPSPGLLERLEAGKRGVASGSGFYSGWTESRVAALRARLISHVKSLLRERS